MLPKSIELFLAQSDSMTIEPYSFIMNLDTESYSLEFTYSVLAEDQRYHDAFKYSETGTWQYDEETGVVTFSRIGDANIEGEPLSFSGIFLEKEQQFQCCTEMGLNLASETDDWLILKNISGFGDLTEVRMKRVVENW